MPVSPDSLMRCPNEITTLRFSQGALQEATFDVKDLSGNPIDLTKLVLPLPTQDCDSESSSSSFGGDGTELCANLFIREAFTNANVIAEGDGDIEQLNPGIVRFALDETALKFAGVYTAEVVFTRSGRRLHVMPLFIAIEPSADSVLGDLSPALTISWIRMMLRDTCPEANFLLDEVEFSDTEIAFALRHPIDEWNETPPPLLQQFTPKTFPFRNFHSRAAIGELLMMSGHWYTRNHLSYSAAGVAVNDRDKGPAYLALGERYRAEWKDWIQNKKIELNVQDGFAQLLSPYTAIDSFYGYYGY